MNEARGIVSSGANAIARAASLATAALSALGVGLSGLGLVNFVRQINNGVDAMNDMADATGSTVEKISALDRIERTFGHSTGTATTALLKFNQSLNATDKAGSDAEKVLTALGLSVTDLKAMDPADALMETAKAMAMFADDGNKARAAQELFGKSLKEVAPLLKDLVEAGELNATVTKQQAQEAEKFNRELFKMQTALTDVGRAIANPVVTGMNGLIEKFRLGAKEGDNFIVTLLKQTEIARLLGANKSGNGYSDIRKELDLLDASLKKGNLTLNERALALERQAELNKRMAAYLNSNAGAGRGISGYGDLPRGSLVLPPETKKTSGGADTAAARAAKELEEQAKLLAELAGLSGSFATDWARLTKLFDARTISVEQLAAAQAELLAQQPFFRKNQKDIDGQTKETLDRWKEEAKAKEEIAAAEAKLKVEREDGARAAESAVATQLIALQKEAREHGVLQSAIAETALAQMEAAREGAYLAGEDIESLNRRIELQKQLVAAIKGKELREANETAAREASESWKQVSDAFVDNLMRGGKSVAQYLKDLFRTLVLRPVIQGVVQVGMNAAGLGGGAATQAGGGLLSNIGTMSSLGSIASSMATAYTAGASSVGVMAGSIAGGGGVLGGAAAALGAIPVAGWIALAGLAIAAIASGGGETRSGGTYDGTKFVEGPSGGEIGGEAVRTAVTATMGMINSTLTALGSSATLAGFLSGLESSEKGRGFAFAGGSLSTGENFGAYNRTLGIQVNRGSMTQEQANAAYALELKRAAAGAIAASDAVGPLADAVRALGDISQATGEAIDTVLNRISKALTEKATLEQRLFELTATDLEKLTKTRNDERAAIDPTNLALLEQIYAQEDLKAAAEKAATAMANVAEVIDTVKIHSQTALDEVNRTQSALLDGYNREAEEKRQLIARSREYAKTLRAERDAMLVGEGSPLNAIAQASVAQAQYQDTLAKALGGDADAQAAYLGNAKQLLATQQATSSTSAQLTTIFIKVREDMRLLADTSDATADVQLLQLNAMTDILQGLGLLQTTQQAGFAALVSAYQGAKAAYVATDPGAGSINALYQSVLGRQGDMGGIAFYQGWLDRGLSLADVAAAMNNSPEKLGIPQMATGTNWLPQDMLVYAHQGEKIVPRAYNPADDGFGELVTVMEDMGERLKAIEDNTKRIRDVEEGLVDGSISQRTRTTVEDPL